MRRHALRDSQPRADRIGGVERLGSNETRVTLLRRVAQATCGDADTVRARLNSFHELHRRGPGEMTTRRKPGKAGKSAVPRKQATAARARVGASPACVEQASLG